MRITAILLHALGVASFTIPGGQPDGVYSVSTSPSGEEIHTLLLANDGSFIDRPYVAGTQSAKFARRQIGGVTNSIRCGGYALNHGDTDSAVNALDAQCGGGANVQGGRDFYSISGCVVAYFCNYNSQADTCFAAERGAVGATVTEVCGSYMAGWDEFASTGRHGQYGYEDLCGAGSKFCGRGT